MSIELINVLQNFKMDKPKKTVFGNYRIEGNELKYIASTTIEKDFSKVDDFKAWIKEHKLTKFRYGYGSSPITVPEIIQKIKDSTYSNFRIKASSSDENVIAKKIIKKDKVILLGNSAILPLVGRTVSYGNETLNRSETEIQKLMVLDSMFQMIPFVVFEQAKLDLNKFELIERGIEEKIEIAIKDSKYDHKLNKNVDYVYTETRHFTGASLFSVDGKFYLFDVDRREVQHKIFNPFLAEINGNPKSIKEAYQILKPKAVIDAEKRGLKVLRQGEWFFIPSDKPKFKRLSEMEKMIVVAGSNRWSDEITKLLGMDKKKLEKQAAALLKEIPRQQHLRAGNSRPNTVTMLLEQNGKIYCSGKVSHSGREHADLILKNWYVAVANTSKRNVTVTGDID